jgi:hypothetical protein
LLIAPAALAATFAFSCGDDESVVGSTGGSGGQTSTGGSAGLGGSGGNGGSSVAGAAGTGGAAGSGAGAGGAAGTGNTAGAAGTAGAGGVANDPDAGDGGTDPDSGTVQLTPQQQAADVICGRLDAVASCPAPDEPCRDAIIGLWDSTKSGINSCDPVAADDYYNCLATDGTATYDCSSGNTPEIATQTGGCQDEETHLFNDCFNN